jgi:uncharacterized protein YhdP
MPYKRRHSGLSATEWQEEIQLWNTIVALLTAIAAIAVLPAVDQAILAGGLLLAEELSHYARCQRHARYDWKGLQ